MTDGVLWTSRHNDIQPLSRGTVPWGWSVSSFGVSLFETFSVQSGRSFRLEAHINRLRAGLATLGWADVAPETIVSGISAVSEAMNLPAAAIRMRVTAFPDLPAGATVVYVQGELYVPPSRTEYARGVDAVITEYTINPASSLTKLKTGQRLHFMLARAEARARGAWEGLLLTPGGMIADGSVSNVHCVMNGTVVTPDVSGGALPGIARQTVRQIAATHGIDWQAAGCTVSMLSDADEAFLTNSLIGVLPLVRLDGRPIGTGSPGPITRRVAAFYEARRKSRAQPVI